MKDYKTVFDDFYTRFLQLEEELDLFDCKIGDIYLWQRERDNIGYRLLSELGYTGGVLQRTLSARDKARAGYLLLRNTVHKNPFCAEPPEIVFVGHPRRKRVDGSWWDIYCDPIYQHAELDYLHLETPWRLNHRTPVRTDNIRYTDINVLLTGLVAQSGIGMYQLNRGERETLAEVESRFQSEFSLDIDLEAPLREAVIQHRVRQRLYKHLLSRLDPQLVVIVASSRNESFIYAAHEAGIPVAELQHGQIGPYSFAYSFPGERTKYTFPDYLLTFGEFWRTTAEYPIDTDRIIPVGYPFLEQRKQELAYVERSDSVLFISTPESGPELSKLAAEVSANDRVSRELVYKLHPSEYDDWQNMYSCLIDTSVNVIGNENATLYELMSSASAQVGVGSTALYEGLAFDLSTYVVPLPTVEWSAPIIENGEAVVVDSADDLATCLADPPCQPGSQHEYFKPNALENISDEISRLVRSGTIANK